MSALSIKGLRAFNPTSLSSHFAPQRRPYLAKQTASLTNRLYSKPSLKQPDNDVLQKLKKVAALRREFESLDGVELRNSSFRYLLKLRLRGLDSGTAMAKVEKVSQLNKESSMLVLDLSRLYWDDQRLFTRQWQSNSVARLEALLEVDAAQPRPVLKLQERLAVRRCLQAYLKDTRSFGRVGWVVALIAIVLLGNSFPWLWKWLYRIPVYDSDFSKIHKPDPGEE